MLCKECCIRIGPTTTLWILLYENVNALKRVLYSNGVDNNSMDLILREYQCTEKSRSNRVNKSLLNIINVLIMCMFELSN